MQERGVMTRNDANQDAVSRAGNDADSVEIAYLASVQDLLFTMASLQPKSS